MELVHALFFLLGSKLMTAVTRKAATQRKCLMDNAQNLSVEIGAVEIMSIKKSERAEMSGNNDSERSAAMCKGLRTAILEGALMPGDRLPEDALGESFGVSRTIARQVLGQLAAEGLVDLRRNRIAVIASPSPEDARDIFDIRLALEAIVVRHLAGQLTEAQAKELRQLVDEEDAARLHAPRASIRLANEFHIRLAEMTGKPVLARYVTEICYRATLALSTLARPHSSDCAINEHLELIAALQKGPVERAVSLMQHHVEAVAERAFLQGQGQVRRDLADILKPYSQS